MLSFLGESGGRDRVSLTQSVPELGSVLEDDLKCLILLFPASPFPVLGLEVCVISLVTSLSQTGDSRE